MTRGFTAVFLLGGAVFLLAGAALAGPVVTVKARTTVLLDPIRRVSGGIEVRGLIMDRSVRGPVPWASVTIMLDDTRVVATAGEDGEFSHRFWITEGIHDLYVSYEGNRTYAPSDATLRGFDVTKDPVELTIRSAREVTTGVPLRVVVKAKTNSGPVSIVAQILIGDESGDDMRVVGNVGTDESGRGEMAIAADDLGKPGRRRVEARFSGSDAYDVATAHTEVLIATQTKIELKISDNDVRYEDTVSGKGRLVDAAGKPIAGAPVGLVAGAKRVADTLTGPDGTFELSVEASELGAGKASLQARFESPEAWRKSSRSTPVTIAIREPQPVPMRYTIAAFAATAFAVFAFVLLRTKPWEPLLARLRADGSAGPNAERDSGPASALRDVRTGLQHARPGLVSTLRRANDFGVQGTIRDAVTGRPLDGADIAIVAEGQPEQQTATGADGEFSFDSLAGGIWTAVVARTAYCTERFEMTLPHRGELRGARVELMPVRERIFRIYRDAALPLLPDPATWGIWTPRQIFDHVRAHRPAEALAALTDFVEERYLSQRIPDEDGIEEARERVRAVQAESSQPMV